MSHQHAAARKCDYCTIEWTVEQGNVRGQVAEEIRFFAAHLRWLLRGQATTQALGELENRFDEFAMEVSGGGSCTCQTYAEMWPDRVAVRP